MANKIYDPKTKASVKGGIKKSGMSFSHPAYNYLGHFRKPEYIKAGHNDSGSMAGVGLDESEVKKFQNSMLGHKPEAPNFLGISAATGAGRESTPAAATIAHTPENRNRMGGLSNQPYGSRVRITTK